MLIQGQGEIVESDFLGPFDLASAKFDQRLIIAGNGFADRVHMSDLSIADSLALSDLSVSGGAPNHWSKGAQLILANASLGVLKSSVADWQWPADQRPERCLNDSAACWINADLGGATYDGLFGHADRTAETSFTPLLHASPKALSAWLWSTTQDKAGLSFDPQPYINLVQTLESAGFVWKAAEIRREQARQRAIAPSTPWWQRVLLRLNGVFSGYGTRPFQSLAWYLLIVVGGAWLFSKSRAEIFEKQRERANQVQLWMTFLAASFANSIPIMLLSNKYFGVDHDRWWVELLLVFHAIIGLGILSLMVASVALTFT